MTAAVLPPLPPEVLGALPQSTAPPPWACRVRAVVWWHRATPSARSGLPPQVRAGWPVTVGALLDYLDSPVGPYREVLACPVLLRGAGLVHTTVPFIAVDSLPSIAGGRVHWGLPKTLAAFAGTTTDSRVSGDGWSLEATTRPFGPALPVRARFSTTQDGRSSARSTVRGRARAARVSVTGRGLPSWLRSGTHCGLVLPEARLVVGAPR